MKIAVIGASGKAGRLIMEEAVARGHEVAAIVRNALKVQNPQVQIQEKDVFDLNAEDLQAYDVVVNAFGAAPGQEHLHVEAGRVLIQALKGLARTRLIVVGGAGSLFVDEAKTVRLMDTAEFPKEYYATASNQGQNLQDLQQSADVQWSFISPAAFFDPQGKQTGSYKKGKDHLITNEKGQSYISYADYAVAVLDEIENPQHKNERFTVVSESE
ncbi:NAD(P)-dependent oxidoreductase [Brevibacillus invocatus]|uniref:NAD(P)-dependent oxidoreductase n=1 Tax=Brevibacillus invocatus TaxID=173959 RepID=UPI00203F67A2|nr:NAD(P)-dependent oxidoreductase [Brevibacillus invocatus]MCM3081826.1 NAD(P)-dependent oxidoreductase [Brevibacillus invocatus]MCM3432233.1 NAD(P)-dependent oxidoreductase [Brevibacillus invocatus]